MLAVATYLKLRYLWPIFVLLIIYTILEILENLLTMDDHSMHGGHGMHGAMDHGHLHGDDYQSVGAMNHNGMHHDGKSIPNYREVNT